MQPRPRDEPYTVVLSSRKRGEGISRPTVVKEFSSASARGSPRKRPPPRVSGVAFFTPPEPTGERPVGGVVFPHASGTRFFARMLVYLLVFQPVYVAFGAELEPVVADVGADIVVVDVPAAVEVPEDAPADVEPDVQSAEDEADSTQEVEVDAYTQEEDVVVADPDLYEDAASEGEAEADQALESEAVTEAEERTESDVVDTSDTSTYDANPEQDARDVSAAQDGTSNSTTETGTETDGAHNAAGDPALETGGASDSPDETATDLDSAADSDDVAPTEQLGAENPAPSETAGEEEDTAEESLGEEDEEELPGDGTFIAQNPQSKFVFGERDCTVVADGEFYCTKQSDRAVRPGRTHVYAALDREGDREIYLARGGTVEQVTDNRIDDFAPVYDEETGRIAWHASVEDRLQVFLRDPVRGTVQVTRGSENNSNPSLSGDRLVWQGWRGNTWEVFLAQRLTGDIVIERLTENDTHDMFPQVRDDLISWQEELEDGTARVMVYDLTTDTTTVLEKDGLGKYENPRFMLVFERQDDNGDVATIGYDVQTGEEVELGTNPNPNTMPTAPQTPADHTGDAVPVEATTGTSSVKTVRNEIEKN